MKMYLLKEIKNFYRQIVGLKPYERIVIHKRFTFNKGELPEFIIAGTQKGGTTTMFKYLQNHKSVFMPKEKELQFFNQSFHRGEGYYRSFFATRKKTDSLILGEASPDYMENPLVPYRMHSLIPDVKLIFLLRNPVHRAYSHYKMVKDLFPNIKLGDFKDEFYNNDKYVENVYSLMKEDMTYFDPNVVLKNFKQKGFYGQHLQEWFRFFDSNQIKVFKSEDFFDNPKPFLDEVTNFLNIRNLEIEEPKKSFSRNYSPIDEGLYHKMMKTYQKDMEIVKQLTGITWE